MIDTSTIEGIIRILFVGIIITAAYIISTRNLLSVVSVFAVQSLTLVFIALALYSLEGSLVLLAIAIITFFSKVLIIPYFITTIQERIRIKRDIEFHFLNPTTSLLISMVLMLVIYMVLSRIMQGTPARESLFFFGAV
ncbi:MAG: hydrogenase subunit, partial [Methanomicrobiales archaeon]|nr:hydrogenase subunit [Methanomicrobiales archaeon]